MKATNTRPPKASMALLIRGIAGPQSGTACSRWTNITSPCGATRSNPSAKRRCSVRVGKQSPRTKWPKATAR